MRAASAQRTVALMVRDVGQDFGATAEPVRIRIDYHMGMEETEAVHLGPYPHGAGELFRVSRPSLCIAGVSREDVVRLEPDDDRYVFFGVVERSAWDTHWLLLPREAQGSPEAYAEFKQAIAGAGCILDGERVDVEGGTHVVISVPPGVPADELTRAYERIIQRTSGLSADAFSSRVGDEARQRNAAHHEQQQREDRAWRRRQKRAVIKARTIRVLIAAVCISAICWWIYAFVTATVLTRPRVVALGMIAALSPSAITTLGNRAIRPLMLGAAVTGLAAFLHAGALSDADHAFVAVALGLLYAFFVGSVGFLFGLSSGFAANDRDLRLTWLLVVLPCLVSSIAGVLYAVTAVIAARAAHAHLLAAQTIRMTGILLTVLLLLVPLRARTLRSIHAVLVPLAFVWLCVWLFGGLR